MSSATAQNVWNTQIPTGGGAGGDFVPVPAGNHPGRIVGLFDVGQLPTLQTDDDGNKKMVDKRTLVLVYELARKQPNGKPFLIADKMTFSLHEKANLFKLVVNVTGIKFEPGQSFDPSAGLLDLPVMVNVVAKGSKDGQKTYSNVSSVGQFPDGFPVPEFAYRTVAWSVSDGSPFPADRWIGDVLVYGKGIAALASESVEGRGRVSLDAPPVGRTTAPRPPGPSPAGNKQLAYPPKVRALMAKYGLSEGYTADDIPAQADLQDATDLAEFSIPF